MRLLLDTHVLLWAMSEPRHLSRKIRMQLDRADVWVSAASIWEIAIKASLGKLRADPQKILAGLEPAGFSLLAVSGEHGARVAELGAFHGDPFDRLLVAQAKVERLVLLTFDEALSAYGSCVSLAD